MNFQQVLSPGSACTTLHCPLTLQSIHVSHGSTYHLSSVVFFGHAKCLFVTLFLCCSSFSVCWFYFCVLKTSSGNVLHWNYSQLNDLSLSHIIFLHLLGSNKLNLVFCSLVFLPICKACNKRVTSSTLVAMKNGCHCSVSLQGAPYCFMTVLSSNWVELHRTALFRCWSCHLWMWY